MKFRRFMIQSNVFLKNAIANWKNGSMNMIKLLRMGSINLKSLYR